MPSGIIMQSSSVGATQEAIEKVLAENGYETTKPEVTPPAEVKTPEQIAAEQQAEADKNVALDPKREDFASDDEFAEAQEEFEGKQEEIEEQRKKEEENKRLAALPHKSRRQKAVEKATKELRDELRKTTDRLAALEGRDGKKPTETTAATVAEPKAPKREDFKTDAEYDDALFDYRYQMRRTKDQQDDARKQQEETQKKLNERLAENFESYQTQVAAFKEEHDDWDEVVNQPIHIPEPVYFAIVDLGKEGPPVTYYLGQHPEKLDELAEMTPYRAAIEVGRIADRLKPGNRQASTERSPKPTPTKIPEPVRPLSTSATSSTLTSREAAKNRDFRAFKAAQRRGA